MLCFSFRVSYGGAMWRLLHGYTVMKRICTRQVTILLEHFCLKNVTLLDFWPIVDQIFQQDTCFD